MRDLNAIQPFFITGGMRSGTTLIAQMLNNHSRLNVTYDNVHFFRFCLDAFDPVNHPENYRALLSNIQARVERRMERPFETVSLLERLDQMKDLTYARIYEEVMSELLLESSTHEWGEKTMMCWTKIPRYLEMFPNGRTILVIRDPRDVVASLRKVTIEPGLRYLNAVFTNHHAMRWHSRYGRELPSKQYCMIQYEQLVTEPETALRRLCNQFEIPFEAEMLDSSRFVDRAGKPWERNTSYESSPHGIDASSVGKYADELSNVELFFVEWICRCSMESFEYSFMGTPLDSNEWEELYQILNDDFVQSRFLPWLKTNEGYEGYPSAPPTL